MKLKTNKNSTISQRKNRNKKKQGSNMKKYIYLKLKFNSEIKNK
jgi:hypothetical protein